MVEMAEEVERHGRLRIFHPIERAVVIHGCDEGEGRRCADEPVALAEQAEVLGRVAVGETEADPGQTLLIIVAVEVGVVAADEDREQLAGEQGGELLDQTGILLVAVEIASAIETGIVATTDVQSEGDGGLRTGRGHRATHGSLDAVVERKQAQNVLFVLEEKVVETHVPALDNGISVTQHLLFEFGSVAVVGLEGDDRQQVQLGQGLRHDIGKEIVPGRVANAEVLVLVGKAHGHGAAPVFTSPGVNVGILQDVVAHAAFIADENHGFSSLLFMRCMYCWMMALSSRSIWSCSGTVPIRLWVRNQSSL